MAVYICVRFVWVWSRLRLCELNFTEICDLAGDDSAWATQFLARTGAMESLPPPKKRKRESSVTGDTIITYYAPDKTFNRLFKGLASFSKNSALMSPPHISRGRFYFCFCLESSLEETKEVVRKKLKLSHDAPLQLLQLRGDKCIELEDGMYTSRSYSYLLQVVKLWLTSCVLFSSEDEDFDAFRTLALSSTSLDVRITLAQSNSKSRSQTSAHTASPGFIDNPQVRSCFILLLYLSIHFLYSV